MATKDVMVLVGVQATSPVLFPVVPAQAVAANLSEGRNRLHPHFLDALRFSPLYKPCRGPLCRVLA